MGPALVAAGASLIGGTGTGSSSSTSSNRYERQAGYQFLADSLGGIAGLDIDLITGKKGRLKGFNISETGQNDLLASVMRSKEEFFKSLDVSQARQQAQLQAAGQSILGQSPSLGANTLVGLAKLSNPLSADLAAQRAAGVSAFASAEQNAIINQQQLRLALNQMLGNLIGLSGESKSKQSSGLAAIPGAKGGLVGDLIG
jgi:hypothetical protein